MKKMNFEKEQLSSFLPYKAEQKNFMININTNAEKAHDARASTEASPTMRKSDGNFEFQNTAANMIKLTDPFRVFN